MSNDLTRRTALKVSAAATTAIGLSSQESAAVEEHEHAATRVDRWDVTHDRVWLGEAFWANPMEDWRIVDGAAECQTGGGDRNIHLLTHQLTNTDGTFEMSVRVGRVESGKRGRWGRFQSRRAERHQRVPQ